MSENDGAIGVGDEVLDVTGRHWICLSPLVPGTCDGLFRDATTWTRQQYASNLPGPLVVLSEVSR